MRPRLIIILFLLLLAGHAAQALFFEWREMQSGQFSGSPTNGIIIIDVYNLNDSAGDQSGPLVTGPATGNDPRADTQILVEFKENLRWHHTYLPGCEEFRLVVTLLKGAPLDWTLRARGPYEVSYEEPQWQRFVASRYGARRLEVERDIERQVLEIVFDDRIAPNLVGDVNGPTQLSVGENVWTIGCSDPWPVFAAGAWDRFWRIAIALGVLLGVSLAIWKFAALVNAPVDPTRCPKCGYGLTESGLCSECGYGADQREPGA